MAKRTPIVCEHLENISRKALEKYQGNIRNYIRGRHGIYALYRRDKLYYVGLAKNLRRRLQQHLNDRHAKSWDRFSVYLTFDAEPIKELESLLLRIVNPPGNRTTGQFFQSENLQTRFAEEVRRHHREELNALIGRKRNTVRTQKTKTQKRRKSRRQPVMADYVDCPLKLRGKYKGQAFRATILEDGTIRFQKKLYTSPSMAAAAACNRRSCNGWQFWKYESLPGHWVLLDGLRE